MTTRISDLRQVAEDEEFHQRQAKRRGLIKQLHYELMLACHFLIGSHGDGNDMAAGACMDRASELRDELEAVKAGCPL